MNQIKEVTQKTRQSEMRHTKEVAKLRKEQRAKDNQIKTLEADKRRRDLVLRRKQEEVGVDLQIIQFMNQIIALDAFSKMCYYSSENNCKVGKVCLVNFTNCWENYLPRLKL